MRTCVYCENTYASDTEFSLHECKAREELERVVLSYLEDNVADFDEITEYLNESGFDVSRRTVRALILNHLSKRGEVTDTSEWGWRRVGYDPE